MRAITEPLRKCDLILIEGGEKTDKEMPKIILVKVIKKKNLMSISSGGAMLGRGGLGPFKCFLKKIEIYALINEISQNFRRFFKEVSFYHPPPLSVCFLEKLLWFNNFPKKEKENQKMPISRFLKRKKKSL